MSMSSSASARQRVVDTASETGPFPFAEAESTSAATETGNTAPRSSEDRSQQQAEAFEKGRQEGQQLVRAEMEAALQKEREQIARTLAAFAAERQNYYHRIEGEVVQLALAIARKILHREAQLDPNALAGIVRVTLEKLDAGTNVSLHVHPKDATEWRHYFAGQMEGAPAAEVHDDPALAPGECRIETSLGATEVGFESQLKEIETGLLDLLAERPATK
jgi:flagellar assembly protein FliH